MNTALLVLRLVPGLLFVGHGLQKLVPRRISPPLLAAMGPRATAALFEQRRMRPGLAMALLAGASEVSGGFMLGSGLVLPAATVLLAAVMAVALVEVHLRNGIWVHAGGVEFPLLMLANVYVACAVGPGALSLDRWAGISDWPGIDWSAQDAVKAAAVVGVGAVGAALSIATGRYLVAPAPDPGGRGASRATRRSSTARVGIAAGSRTPLG